jgi:hypothetical protein
MRARNFMRWKAMWMKKNIPGRYNFVLRMDEPNRKRRRPSRGVSLFRACAMQTGEEALSGTLLGDVTPALLLNALD